MEGNCGQKCNEKRNGFAEKEWEKNTPKRDYMLWKASHIENGAQQKNETKTITTFSETVFFSHVLGAAIFALCKSLISPAFSEFISSLEMRVSLGVCFWRKVASGMAYFHATFFHTYFNAHTQCITFPLHSILSAVDFCCSSSLFRAFIFHYCFLFVLSLCHLFLFARKGAFSIFLSFWWFRKKIEETNEQFHSIFDCEYKNGWAASLLFCAILFGQLCYISTSFHSYLLLRLNNKR